MSKNRKAALTLKAGGNLVLECMNTDKELWSSGTSGEDVRLKIQVPSFFIKIFILISSRRLYLRAQSFITTVNWKNHLNLILTIPTERW